MAESKSARKNRRRREAKKTSEGFTIEEEVKVQSASAPIDVDPLTELQRQLSEAKAAKDHDKAQELRHKIWVLQDTLHLGRPPPDAPPVDLEAISRVPERPKAEGTSGDPTERKLAKLRKKLEQIESLQVRQSAGEKLEKNQLVKIESLTEVQEEIKILVELLRTHSLS